MIIPSYIAIDLTYLCPLKCNFCFIKNSKKQKEINIDYLEKLVKNLRGGKKHFYITGGEPLLKEWLGRFISIIKNEGHTCLVTTNGLLLRGRKLKEILKSGPDEIAISLHGPKKIHDKLCGKSGSFSIILENILTFLSDASRRTSISIWCTITPDNHHILHDFYLFLSKLGVDKIVFNHLEFISQKDFAETQRIFLKELNAVFNAKPSEERVRGLNPMIVAEQINEIKKHNNKNVRFYPDLNFDEILKWYTPTANIIRKGFCKGQFNSLWISPYGRLITCQPLAYDIGELNPDDPYSLLNGLKYSRFRKTLIKHRGLLPACSRCGRVSHKTTIIPLSLSRFYKDKAK
ncbi:MAG: radical SAM protein [Elusimicrobiota bacterium]